MNGSSVAAPPRSSLSTYAWLATVPLIWGTHFVALKIVFTEFSVFGMLSVRYALMILALIPLLWFAERDMRIAWRDVPYLVGFSLVMVSVYQIVFALAIDLATAAESALLISTAPVFAALTAGLLRWEKITKELVVGVALGLVGIFAVIYGGRGLTNMPEADTHIRGCLLMLVAAIMWAWYAVLAKPLLAKYSPLKTTAYCQTIGGLAVIPIGFHEAVMATPRVFSEALATSVPNHASWVLFGLIYYAWFSGAYAFTIWYRGVHLVGSSKTMLFQFCVPVVGLVAAIVFRGEYPNWLQWIGAGLTLAGVIFAARRHSRRPSPETQSDAKEEADAPNATG